MKSNGCRDVQHTDLQIKAHKQEGTLVSKVHKQGALGTPSQASLHITTWRARYLYDVESPCRW